MLFARVVESTSGRSVLRDPATALTRPSRKRRLTSDTLAEGRPLLKRRTHLGTVRPSLFILLSYAWLPDSHPCCLASSSIPAPPGRGTGRRGHRRRTRRA